MIAALDAQANNVGAGLDNIAAGYGIGGPSDNSNDSNNNSNKPSGGNGDKPSSNNSNSGGDLDTEDTTLESGD